MLSDAGTMRRTDEQGSRLWIIAEREGDIGRAYNEPIKSPKLEFPQKTRLTPSSSEIYQPSSQEHLPHSNSSNNHVR